MKADKKSSGSFRFAQGFTLFEAFIVLTIIAIMAIISVPAIMNTLSYQKLSSATNSFVNQVEFARVQAASRNRAYQLRVELSDGNNSGAIHLDEGIGSACTPATFQSDGVDPEPMVDVRVIDFLEKGLSAVKIEEVEPGDIETNDGALLCIKPDGRVLRVDTGSAIAPPPGYAAGEAVFTLRLYSEPIGAGNPEATNLVRQVVIPYNGIPKVVNAP
jgi:competence protein ComGC